MRLNYPNKFNYPHYFTRLFKSKVGHRTTLICYYPNLFPPPVTPSPKTGSQSNSHGYHAPIGEAVNLITTITIRKPARIQESRSKAK